MVDFDLIEIFRFGVLGLEMIKLGLKYFILLNVKLNFFCKLRLVFWIGDDLLRMINLGIINGLRIILFLVVFFFMMKNLGVFMIFLVVVLVIFLLGFIFYFKLFIFYFFLYYYKLF